MAGKYNVTGDRIILMIDPTHGGMITNKLVGKTLVVTDRARWTKK